MSDRISKVDFDSAIEAVEKILKTPVESIELADNIPILNDISDSNKVFKGKVSILFVDMHGSTDLTDEIKSKKMVKIYRSFIRLIIQAIRYSGGYSRQFAGDGIMGVFQDSDEEGLKTKSSEKAIIAGRYISTLIDYCLNPMLEENLNDTCIACGIGICTGTVMITKAGMRGKEQKEDEENEHGIVWVGSVTNYASRFCDLANACEIFIDEKTYEESGEDLSNWTEFTRVKGMKSYEGYVAENYYLDLEEGIKATPIISIEEFSTNENSFVQEIFEQISEEAILLIDTIADKSGEVKKRLAELGRRDSLLKVKEKECADNEQRLKKWDSKLQNKQTTIETKERQNKWSEYRLNRNIFSDTYCKDDLIKLLGKDFWIPQISKMIVLGEAIGKSELEVIQDMDCYLVKMYNDLEMYEEAYDALCIQAEYSSWLNDYVVEQIVRNSGHWARLKSILEKRINPGHKKDTNDYLKALDKLKQMGY